MFDGALSGPDDESGVGRLDANFSHRDAIAADTVSPLNGLRILAQSALCETQVIAAGDHIRGVQFHPEFDGAITAAYVQHSYDALASDAARPGSCSPSPERLLKDARDCPAAERVFHNFLRHFVAKS